MFKARRFITAGGTLICALGIGFLMQTNAQQDKEATPAPEPVAAKVLQDEVGAPETSAQEGTTVELSDIQLTAADTVTPPKAAPQPKTLPESPITRAAFDPASAAETPVGDLPKEEPAPEFSCEFNLTATPGAAAMVTLDLEAPCMVNERFTLHHNGLMFTAATDDEGMSQMTVPALAKNAVFIVAFGNGEGAVANAEVSSVEYYDRYVVQWQGQSGLQVHALEYGATYGEDGHVWADAKRDMGIAARGEGGFITRLGPRDMDDARMAEVYTFPTLTAQKPGEIDLRLEAAVTRANCGRDIEAQSLHISGTQAPVASDLTLAMPECDAIGDYLVLKNMFNDLKIARNCSAVFGGTQMSLVRAAFRAALFLFCMATATLAQDVTLTSRDGDVEISGNLLGFDGEFYRVDTVYGELTVDGSGVLCDGPGCPNLENYVARVTLSGAPVIGRVLMPALIEAFAIRNDYGLERVSDDDRGVTFALSDGKSGRLIGEFTFRLTNTDEGFADLLANEADMVMSLREARQSEVRRAREAGLGDLDARGRSRVLALDALVPVVAPSNPVQAITVPALARVMAGEIDNWRDLGGPNAPIAVHLRDARSGLGQATVHRLLGPLRKSLVQSAVRHEDTPSLIRAVTEDPFAIGVTSHSETGNTWELALKGDCGFALRATRRAVKTEDYPLTAPLFLYMPALRFPKLVREFLSYMRDPSAQLVIRRAGFVDQSPEEIAINAQGDRFANAIARAGTEVGLGELQRMVKTLAPLRRLTTTFRFEAGSARLDAQSRSNVRQLARAMEVGLYDARRLVFVGFSDGEGPAAANRDIALRRAQTVRDAVTSAAETANLTRIKLEVEAFGEAMPMACDDSAWGRQVNRRVEVWVR